MTATNPRDRWIVHRGTDEALTCQDCYEPIDDGQEAVEVGDDILHAHCHAALIADQCDRSWEPSQDLASVPF